MLSLLLLLACAHRTPSSAELARQAAHEAAVAGWRGRAEPGVLEASAAELESWILEHPKDRQALALLARADWALAERDPGRARERLDAAQDAAARCLLTFAGFRADLGAQGYRITAPSVASLPSAAGPCVLWYVVSGVALVELRGPGAALDLDPLGALASWLVRTDGVDAPGFVPWAVAKLQGLSPDGGDPGVARRLYEDAIQAAPDVLLFRVDYARAFPDARDHALAGYEPADPDPWAREAEAWRAELDRR